MIRRLKEYLAKKRRHKRFKMYTLEQPSYIHAKSDIDIINISRSIRYGS